MTISEFEQGKTHIMAEAREALRRIGVESHSVMFDVHASQPVPLGANLTVAADDASANHWFTADEINASSGRTVPADIRAKIALLAAGVKDAVIEA